MKVERDLTQKIVEAEKKDKFYRVSGRIIRLLAPQWFTRPFTYTKKGWGEIQRVETTTDGTAQDLRAPQRKRKVRKGESEVKGGDCWTFKRIKVQKDGKLAKIKGDEEEHIVLPFGGHFGLMKSSLRRSLEAQRKLKYDAAPLGLMAVYPTWLDIGLAPSESEQGTSIPEVILETRHTQRGDVRVEAFFDYIANREFSCILEIDSECPIDEGKLMALLKSLNTLDNVGASKRGKMEILKVESVTLEDEEVEKLKNGTEPTMPVIY